jgi:hypothetical protein
MPTHKLILLGDSILDNSPYTAPEPDTAAHLRRLLGEAWTVELGARDGAVMDDVPSQLRRAADAAATAVLSVGGNDVLPHVELLTRPATDAAALFGELLAIADAFGRRYEQVARETADRFGRTVLCTIYEAPLEPARFARLARAPLAVLNDRIIRTAVRLGLEILELRELCTEPGDFVLQIEPSPAGAQKIAEAIARLVGGDGAGRRATIHGAR